MLHRLLRHLVWVCDLGVGEGGVFRVIVDGVDMEAVDSPMKSKAHGGIIDDVAAVWILPTQVWHLL